MWDVPHMAIKPTSEVIIISGTIDESAANTTTTKEFDLQLNPLDNEAFMVLGVQSDLAYPDAVDAINTGVGFSLSTTSRNSLGNLSSTNVFHVHNMGIRGSGGTTDGAAFDQVGPDSPQAMNLDYICLIATDQFYAQIAGQGNLVAKSADFKIYGRRVRLDSAQYAALVQSELLSS